VVEESRLNPGDELAIGPLLYRLDFEEEKLEAGISPAPRPSAIARPAAPGSRPPRRAGSPADANSEDDLIPLDDI
jgi:hypothetical protein